MHKLIFALVFAQALTGAAAVEPELVEESLPQTDFPQLAEAPPIVGWSADLASDPIASADGFDHGHAVWDGILRAHVDARGMVDYAALKKDSSQLDAYLAEIAALPAEEVGGWSRSRQIAFYINAYNAITFRAILDAYPLKSIRDIKPDPWENNRWSLAGRTVSLNWIEHTKLRGHLGEARVHFVLVCAAIGCPRLPNRAIVATSLESQLDSATKAFFVDPAKNRVDAEGGKVYLSKIMEWYGEDFVDWKGTPSSPSLDGRSAKEAASVRLLGSFVGESDKAFLAKNGFSVVYNEYDWALNSQ